ncbi:MAG: putative DNA binding domain-containing protein [Anaerolineaceae bacterium]|nr:putative DNA binding domain-containing protein [Anaerolineaceae bacterium]
MTIKLTSTDTVLTDKFFALTSPEDVADLLELKSYSFLEYLIFILPSSKRYREFIIPKRRGGKRYLLEPIPNLKIVQKKLSYVLQLIYKPKHAVHGYVNGKSIVTNATQHIGRRYLLNIDLEDFFPSIHFGRVRGMFMSYPYNFNGRVATTLAQICSLRNCLPQGAPTSPIISNMICAKMDSELQKLAKQHRCYYTRYADDLTFSTSIKQFPPAMVVTLVESKRLRVEVGIELSEIINRNGFNVNMSKIRLQKDSQRQEVTNLTTNEFVNVNRKYIRQIRAMLHAWRKFGYVAAENEYRNVYNKKPPDKPYKNAPSLKRVIKGKIDFVKMVRGQEDKLFIKLNNQAAQLERAERIEPYFFDILQEPDHELMTVIANGETDLVEFKEGACVNPHTGKDDKRNMSSKILRAVASLMNSKSNGVVLIGVADNGAISGVEREYSVANPAKANWDGYELYLNNLLNDSLSVENAYKYFNISSLTMLN